jgi:hypothetical protein
MAAMRPELAGEIHDFVEAGDLWHPDRLQTMVHSLEAQGEADGDPLPAMLARHLSALLVRLRMGDIDARFAKDIEGIVYPRLWKVMEAIRDDMPDGELRTRIEVMNRRLARRFADESEPEAKPEGDRGTSA